MTADDKKTAALHLLLTKKPKAQVQESFYKGIVDEYDSDKNGTYVMSPTAHSLLSHTCNYHPLMDRLINCWFGGVQH